MLSAPPQHFALNHLAGDYSVRHPYAWPRFKGIAINCRIEKRKPAVP
jgi:hypothetical protein